MLLQLSRMDVTKGFSEKSAFWCGTHKIPRVIHVSPEHVSPKYLQVTPMGKTSRVGSRISFNLIWSYKIITPRPGFTQELVAYARGEAEDPL